MRTLNYVGEPHFADRKNNHRVRNVMEERRPDILLEDANDSHMGRTGGWLTVM